jgi:hypothetical protein
MKQKLMKMNAKKGVEVKEIEGQGYSQIEVSS